MHSSVVLVHSHCATVTAIHLHNVSSQSLYSFNTHSPRLLAATILFCLWELLKVLYINVIRQCLSFCDWLIWLNHPQGSSIHTVACVGISFLKLGNILLYVCIYTHHVLCIHLSVGGHLWLPPFGYCEYGYAHYVWVAAFKFFEYIPKTGIAGSKIILFFNFLSNRHIVFHRGCMILQLTNCTSIPVSSHPHQDLAFFCVPASPS